MRTINEVLRTFADGVVTDYDFSSAEYYGALKPITGIKCPEHGEFSQYAGQLQKPSGARCPTCGKIKRGLARRVTAKEILAKLRKVHGDTYVYPRLEADPESTPGTSAKIEAVCAEHGSFTAHYSNLLNGKGCPQCGAAKRGRYVETYETPPQQRVADMRKARAAAEFVERCRQVHGDRYDYTKTAYVGARQPVTIICTTHGEFTQVAMKHLSVGQGCPRCSHRISKGEQEVVEYLRSIGAEFEQQNRSILAPAELDIWLPEYNTAIEFNGAHWHADDRPRKNTCLSKFKACQEKGIRLISIFDFEWDNHRHAVKAILCSAVRAQKSIGARSTEVDAVTPAEARSFLEKWHVGGFANAKIYLGMRYAGELVGVASFARSRFEEGTWELVRYATSAHIIGGLDKCIKAARKIEPFQTLVSYCDMRYGTGQSYRTAGFVLDSMTPPDYWWFKGGTYLKRYQTQKHKLQSNPLFAEFYADGKTEKQICEEAGYRKVTGVGHTKWVRTF